MRPRAPRHATRSSVILTARGMGRRFTLTNVSKSGAGLTGDKQLNIGEGVILNYPGGGIDGTVRWTKERTAGVAFSRDLDSAILQKLIAASAGESGARPTAH